MKNVKFWGKVVVAIACVVAGNMAARKILKTL